MLDQLINADFIERVDDIVRFNGIKTIQTKETVSQHTFWVVFYSSILFKELFFSQCSYEQDAKLSYHSYNYLYNRLIRLALFHDTGEVITGDVLFTVKHDPEFGKGVREALENIEMNGIKEMTDSHLKDEMKEIWMISRFRADDDKLILMIKKILKLADWISCIKFAWHEVSLGNQRFRFVLNNCHVNITQILHDLEELMEENDIPFSHLILPKILEDLQTFR